MFLKRFAILGFALLCVGLLSGCSEARYAAHVVKQIPMPGDSPTQQGTFKIGTPYNIKGRRYYPRETYSHVETGIASWYGPKFHGKRTANGETFNKYELTAAHRTLQMPSIIRVTNLHNGRNVILRVNDRGPFAHDRVLDVSEKAASLLGFKNAGTARVKIEVLGEESQRVAAAAKTGQDTRGFEVALNQNKSRLAPPRPTPPMRKPEPITQVAMSQSTPYQGPTPAAPLRKPLPVQAEPLTATPVSAPVPQPAVKPVTYSGNPLISSAHAAPIPPKVPGKLFVQAGSFSQEQNALNYSSELSSYGPSKVYLTRINNQPFFRVRLGPYDNREDAQRILSALNESGNKNAVIVID